MVEKEATVVDVMVFRRLIAFMVVASRNFMETWNENEDRLREWHELFLRGAVSCSIGF